MRRIDYNEIPSQKKLVNSIDTIPIEYFKWGQYPDHFKIDMPHRHEFTELLFLIKGGGTHEIGFKEYEIESASIHYIPKSTVHFLKREIQSDGFTIAFDTKYLEENEVHRFINPLKIDPFALSLPSENFENLLNQATSLISRIKEEKGYYQEKCFLLSLELLLNSIASEKGKVNKRVTRSSLIKDFKYLVKTNIHLHHNVFWFANELNVSSKYLGNYVKKELQVTAKTYIIESLLEAIKRELINTNKSLSHIAFDHNLDNSSLSKLFKKHVGYTMTEYREGM